MTEETADAVADPEEANAENASQEPTGKESETSGDASAGESPGNADTPEFAELKHNNASNESSAGDLKRLNDVQVAVSAELGRTKVSIQQLLKLTEGSVFELNRSIESPVELIAQGVPLGNGEVVVVDGNFAIRIQEIYATQ